MKCIILLSFVALCYSYPYGSGYGSGYGYGSGLGSTYISGKNFNINPDGSITVTTANGGTITISKGIGQNTVTVTAPTGYQGSQSYYGFGYQPYQTDALSQILSQYQGNVNQNVYQQLLGQIAYGVQTGQISNAAYKALQNLQQGGYWGSQTTTPFRSQANGPVFGGPAGQVGPTGQQYPLYLTGAQQQQQQTQYPYGQTFQKVFFPVGMTQQGQMVPQRFPVVSYPTGFMSGNQAFLAQPGFNQGSTGMTSFKALIDRMLNGYYPQQSNMQYIQYGQQFGPVGQPIVDQFPQMVQGQKVILGQQNQIQQGQLQQQQNQEQMLGQQFQEEQLQQQLQNKQQYVQEVQEQQEQEQEEVLEQQQLQQKQQQLQKQYNVLKNIINGGMPFVKTTGQQTGFWQQQPSVYSQEGLYGVYGQGMQDYNFPMVL